MNISYLHDNVLMLNEIYQPRSIFRIFLWLQHVNLYTFIWISFFIINIGLKYISILKLSNVCLSVSPSVRDIFLKNPYISSKNKDNDTKLSGCDPWGLPRSSMLSRMTLSSKSPIRNPQRTPSTPHLDLCFLTLVP